MRGNYIMKDINKKNISTMGSKINGPPKSVRFSEK